MDAAVIMAFLLLSCGATAYATDAETQPVQELGTIVYFVPLQHAERDYGGGDGLVAFVLQQTDENDIRPTFIAHSAAEFVDSYQRLPRELQQYGIWLTLQKGDPYSPDEKAMLEELKALCSKRKFPLLIHVDDEGK